MWFVAPLTVMILIIAACSSSDDPVSPASTAPPPAPTTTTATTAAPTTTSGNSGEPTATYTGGDCDYDGPSEFDVNSTVTFKVTNESDHTDVGFAVLKFPEGSTAQEVFSEGISAIVPDDDAPIDFRAAPTVIGTEYDLTVTFTETGQHGINCFDQSGGGIDETEADHVTMFTVGE